MWKVTVIEHSDGRTDVRYHEWEDPIHDGINFAGIRSIPNEQIQELKKLTVDQVSKLLFPRYPNYSKE